MAPSWTVVGSQQLGTLAPGSVLYGCHEGSGVHLTGFTDPMLSVGNIKSAALMRMSGKSYLTWGGDHYNAESFTAIIPDFLGAVEGSKVLAFRNRGNHEQFKQSWNTFAEQYRGRFYIIEIDAQAEAARHGVLQEANTLGGAARFFLLGRLAVKMCGTRSVVALGGGGIVSHEMRCSVANGARWTVFALSRGRQEQSNTLMDEAAQNSNVELVLNVDAQEAQAFARGRPATPHPPPAWSHLVAAAGGGFGGHQPVPGHFSGFFGQSAACAYQPPAAGQQAHDFQPKAGDKCKGKDANGQQWDVTILRAVDADNFEVEVHDGLGLGTKWPAIHRVHLSPPPSLQPVQPSNWEIGSGAAILSPTAYFPVPHPSGGYKCKQWNCSKPSWNQSPDQFCSVRCRDSPEPWHGHVAPQLAPPPMQPVPQPAAQQAPVLPLNGGGIEDVQSIGYMPLVNFITDYQPTKTCEVYMRQGVSGLPMMAPVARFIEDIVSRCKQCSQQMMANGIAQRFPGLSHDMVFAVIAFTFDLQIVNLQARDENEFYRQYNNALRQRNAQAMRAFVGYSHFLFSAVSLMPVHEGVLWRGICGDDAVRLATERYGDGMQINWSAWSSASVSRDVAKETFATQHGAARGLLFRIETRKSARDISQLSVMPREQERVIFPNTKLIVVRPYHTAADGIGEIHLKELSNNTFVF